MTRRPLIAIAAVLLALPVAAQQVQQGGHGLDGNLRLGSGGYNGFGGGGGAGYANPYVRRAYRMYGGSWNDYYNAFQQNQRYDPSRTMQSFTTARQYGGASQGPDQSAIDRYTKAYDAGYDAALEEVQAADQAGDTEAAARQMDLISYGIGWFLGEAARQRLQRDGLTEDSDTVTRGFRDGLFENAPALPREQLEAILADLDESVRKGLVDRLMTEDPEFRRQAETNLLRGRAFHDAYGSRDDVVTLDNGIQYRVLESGDGPSPGPDDVVVLDYRVMLLDGTIVAEGQGAEVEVNDVTRGAAIVLQMMKPGDRWEVAIPPNLAHGQTGNPPTIGPNETMFGVVKLVRVKE